VNKSVRIERNVQLSTIEHSQAIHLIFDQLRSSMNKPLLIKSKKTISFPFDKCNIAFVKLPRFSFENLVDSKILIIENSPSLGKKFVKNFNKGIDKIPSVSFILLEGIIFMQIILQIRS
jgi:hypothetical protein